MNEKSEIGGLRDFNRQWFKIGMETRLVNSDGFLFRWGGSLGRPSHRFSAMDGFFLRACDLTQCRHVTQGGSSNTAHITCSQVGKGREMNERDMGEGHRIWGCKIQRPSCGRDAQREMGETFSGAQGLISLKYN